MYLTCLYQNNTLFNELFNVLTIFSLCLLLPLLLLSFLLFCLSVFFPRILTMMTSYKKSVHSLLGLTSSLNPSAVADDNLSFKCHPHVSSFLSGGLSLINATDEQQRPTNIIESASVKPSPPSSPKIRKDPGGFGFTDDSGGGVDWLMSCTESLGFESSDERQVDDQIAEKDDSWSTVEARAAKWRKVGYDKRTLKSFPPPISSLNQNGQPSFFLRPVRKDGRLELTKVRIHRPEILHASRQDGRLRLDLIRDETAPQDYDLEEEEEEQDVEEAEEEEEEEEQEIDQEQVEQEGQEVEQEEEERVLNVLGVEVIRCSEEKEEGRVEEWKFPVSGKGLRRCHEMTSHHHQHHHRKYPTITSHHHHLHVWNLSQPCVTTS